MKPLKSLGLCLMVLSLGCFCQTSDVRAEAAEAENLWINTVGGTSDALPAGYVPPLISNGSLCMLIDRNGGQSQRGYFGMTPTVWREGRRYDFPAAPLIPFGHFTQELTIDGKPCGKPVTWSQTLDTRSAATICRNEYADGLTVETTVFTPLDHELIVVKKRFTTKNASPSKVDATLRYQFSPSGQKVFPRRVAGQWTWNEARQTAECRYSADGRQAFDGVISIFSDAKSTATIDGPAVALTSALDVTASKPVETTTYLAFADLMDGKDYMQQAAKLESLAKKEGFDGLFAEHQKQWQSYWDQSYVHLPDRRLERVYRTAQYHMRANATKWSFPVGIFNTHWAGRFFGWDEMFCYQALVSSGHFDVARRCPEFRFAGLKIATTRASHYGAVGKYGARYPWETLENGTESAPPGFWYEHIFHMSNIAQSAWFQYLYTNDLDYLRAIGYPVIKECARFFRANMIYENADGSMFLGKCTDLERLGPARQNPFMTSCGAIYTLEAAAQAAELLKQNADEAADWKNAAAKLRESLPHNADRYLPYAGCTEESVAALGGLFPYPLFDAGNALQKNAAYHFIENGQRSGNMYPVGKSLCAWYAGWLAAATAALEDKREPAKLLSKAAEGAGCFAEMFEIHEAKVSMHPWFATASGNVIYALNQMLVQSRGDEISIAPGVPETWRDYSFKLPCHGNLAVEVAVENGKLAKLSLTSGDPNAVVQRTLVLPAALADHADFQKAAIVVTSEKNNDRRLTVKFQGRLELIATK